MLQLIDPANQWPKEWESQVGAFHRFEPAKILIVDDDIDAVLFMESIFRNLGCETITALEPKVAKKELCARGRKLVILDWMLGANSTADDLILAASQILAQFGRAEDWQESPIGVITYSSLPMEEIHFPKNPFFRHIGHWKKPMGFRKLYENSLKVCEEIGV